MRLNILFFFPSYEDYVSFIETQMLSQFIKVMTQLLADKETLSMRKLFGKPKTVQIGTNVELRIRVAVSKNGFFYRSAVFERHDEEGKISRFWVRFESLSNLLDAIQSLITVE